MQKKVILAVLVGAVLIGVAVGAGAVALNRGDGSATTVVAADAVPSTPESTPTTEAPTTATPTPEPSPSHPVNNIAELVITPGAIGPIRVGMSQSEAMETGYFDADVTASESCGEPFPLAFKQRYNSVMVWTDEEGEIVLLESFEGGPRTSDGFGAGTTWGELKDSVEPELGESVYGRALAFIYEPDDDGWIGFVFDTTADDISDSDPVAMVQITRGYRPEAIESGC